MTRPIRNTGPCFPSGLPCQRDVLNHTEFYTPIFCMLSVFQAIPFELPRKPPTVIVKNIKQYSGYYGCDRCYQKGQWLGRLTYQETDNLTLRTNVSFRQEQQQHHHRGRSPFCDLPIDMVSAFPVDYMHQVISNSAL